MSPGFHASDTSPSSVEMANSLLAQVTTGTLLLIAADAPSAFLATSRAAESGRGAAVR